MIGERNASSDPAPFTRDTLDAGDIRQGFFDPHTKAVCLTFNAATAVPPPHVY